MWRKQNEPLPRILFQELSRCQSFQKQCTWAGSESGLSLKVARSSGILSWFQMYPVYHEMDISRFADHIDEIMRGCKA